MVRERRAGAEATRGLIPGPRSEIECNSVYTMCQKQNEFVYIPFFSIGKFIYFPELKKGNPVFLANMADDVIVGFFLCHGTRFMHT